MGRADRCTVMYLCDQCGTEKRTHDDIRWPSEIVNVVPAGWFEVWKSGTRDAAVDLCSAKCLQAWASKAE